MSEILDALRRARGAGTPTSPPPTGNLSRKEYLKKRLLAARTYLSGKWSEAKANVLRNLSEVGVILHNIMPWVLMSRWVSEWRERRQTKRASTQTVTPQPTSLLGLSATTPGGITPPATPPQAPTGGRTATRQRKTRRAQTPSQPPPPTQTQSVSNGQEEREGPWGVIAGAAGWALALLLALGWGGYSIANNYWPESALAPETSSTAPAVVEAAPATKTVTVGPGKPFSITIEPNHGVNYFPQTFAPAASYNGINVIATWTSETERELGYELYFCTPAKPCGEGPKEQPPTDTSQTQASL